MSLEWVATITCWPHSLLKTGAKTGKISQTETFHRFPGNFFNIAWQLRHKEQKLLDGHLALAMIAPCLAGNLVGSIMNQLLPSTLIMILLLILAVTWWWKEVNVGWSRLFFKLVKETSNEVLCVWIRGLCLNPDLGIRVQPLGVVIEIRSSGSRSSSTSTSTSTRSSSSSSSSSSSRRSSSSSRGRGDSRICQNVMPTQRHINIVHHGTSWDDNTRSWW